MRFLKKNFWTLSCLALVMVMAVSGNALADGNTLMETAQTKEYATGSRDAGLETTFGDI